jgi:hypothetical protein
MDPKKNTRRTLLACVFLGAITLAAAYAEADCFAEVVTTAEKPKTLAEQANQMELAAKNRTLLELYRSGQPGRDTP